MLANYTSYPAVLYINAFAVTLGARGFLREEPRSAISEARSGEERENRQEVRKLLLVARDS